MPPINAPTWKQLAKGCSRDAKFARPASESRLISVEQALGLPLPQQLRELLLEADGVSSFNCGRGIIWQTAHIRKRNLQFRTQPDLRNLYMPFDHLLFFGDDGSGNLFAFAIHADGQFHKQDVFRWDHETDSRSWYAGGLEQFLESRLNRNREIFKLYEVIRWNCEHQPENGDDTLFLVRARSHEEAFFLAIPQLERLPHTKVRPYPSAVYELGIEQRVRPEYYEPEVVRGPYYQAAYRRGWRMWWYNFDTRRLEEHDERHLPHQWPKP